MRKGVVCKGVEQKLTETFVLSTVIQYIMMFECVVLCGMKVFFRHCLHVFSFAVFSFTTDTFEDTARVADVAGTLPRWDYCLNTTQNDGIHFSCFECLLNFVCTFFPPLECYPPVINITLYYLSYCACANTSLLQSDF